MRSFLFALVSITLFGASNAMACQDFSGTYELNGCQVDNGSSSTIRIFDLKRDKRIGHYTRISIRQTKCKSINIEYGDTIMNYKAGRESYLSPYNSITRDSISTKFKNDSINLLKRSGELLFRDKSELKITKTEKGLDLKGDYVFRGFMTGKEVWSTTCNATKVE